MTINSENFLLGANNAIKISDFGAAYCNDSEVTQVLFVGSLAFMPPEIYGGFARGPDFRKAEPGCSAHGRAPAGHSAVLALRRVPRHASRPDISVTTAGRISATTWRSLCRRCPDPEIEGVSLRQASASLQARFSNDFLRLMVNRLRNADERFIASVGLHV